MGFSNVKLREEDLMIQVKINPVDGAEFSESIIEKWQKLLNLTADIYEVPAALIMRIHENEIEVLVTNNNVENPYEKHETATLGDGLYCETVIATDKELEVANSLKSQVWKDNPDVALNMISYYGIPIKWPKGEFFGTICVLDSKERHFNHLYKSLLHQFKDTVEKDIELNLNYVELEKAKERQEKLQDLLIKHDRIKTFDHLYSTLTHEINTPIGVALATATFIENKVVGLKNSLDVSNVDAMKYVDNLVEATDLMSSSIENASKIILTAKKNFSVQENETETYIDMTEYIHSLLLSMKYELKSKNITYDIDSKLQGLIYTYPMLISQVIYNLVSNSIKHGFDIQEDAKIQIQLEDHKNHYEIIYMDNGKGLTEDSEQDIFKPFFKGSIGNEGSGMGMTIIKDIVENKLQGDISILPSQNKGVVFKLVLPKERN